MQWKGTYIRDHNAMLPIWIIAGKRRESGYIRDNHLNQTE